MKQNKKTISREERSRKYYKENREKLLEVSKQWRINNRKKANHHHKKYYRNNKKLIIEQARSWQALHPKHVREACIRWQKNHPDIIRMNNKSRMCKSVGLLYDEYVEILKKQKNKCAICNKKETRKINNRVVDLSIDHNHKTNKYRGLLCSKCNAALGHLNEDPVIINNMLRYIKKWNKGLGGK